MSKVSGARAGVNRSERVLTHNEIISRHPLLPYCQARGLELRRDGPRWKCLCPLHAEQTPSFIIDPRKNLWHCFGCGKGGSVIDLHATLRGISIGAAMAKLSGHNGASSGKKQSCALVDSKLYNAFTDERKARCRSRWPAFDTPTQREIEALAELRGLSSEGVSLTAEGGLLFCCDSREGRAYVVTDSRRINAQARRLDGRCWSAKGGAKSWTFPGSVASWPIGLREAQTFPAIALVEGGPDLLAAFHLAWCVNREKEIAPIAVLGASMAIPTPVLPLFAGKHVRIFAHRDNEGLEAEARWWHQLHQAGVRVDRYNLSGFITVDGQCVNDVNDFVRICPYQWEAERQTIEEAFLIK
jgi:hypothetical protein